MPFARQIAKMRRTSARNSAQVFPQVESTVKVPTINSPSVDAPVPISPDVTLENPPQSSSQSSSQRTPEVVSAGGARQLVDPLTSFLLNMMFVALLYFVATKIFTFYGISTEAYGIYFTFYLFLYLTTMLLPTEYAKI